MVRGRGRLDPMVSMVALSSGMGVISMVMLVVYGLPPHASWIWALASGTIHIGYYWLLLSSYRHGGLGEAYPLARGSAPLYLLIVAALGESVITPTQWGGAVLLIAGLIAMRPLSASSWIMRRYALGTGLMIACYSYVDMRGVRLSDSAIAYKSLGSFFAAVLFTLSLLPFKVMPWRQLGQAKLVWTVGAGVAFTAYFLAVWAMQSTPVALVSALRETSIVFAVVIGGLFLREKVGARQVCCAAIAVSGVVLIRV